MKLPITCDVSGSDSPFKKAQPIPQKVLGRGWAFSVFPGHPRWCGSGLGYLIQLGTARFYALEALYLAMASVSMGPTLNRSPVMP